MKKVVSFVVLAVMCVVALSTSALAGIKPDDPDAGATVTVTVTDKDNAPLEGAAVYYNEDFDNVYKTDAEGKVTITGIKSADVQGKKVPVAVTKEGYDYVDAEADFTEKLDATVNVTLTAENGSFAIQVFADEEPVEGALVTLDGDELGTTNEFGRLSVNNLFAPDYVGKTVPFTVYKDGYVEYAGEADYTEGFEYMGSAELVAEKASLTFTVMSGTMVEPEDIIEGATITFEGKTYTTDEKGKAVVSDLSAPAYIFKEFSYTVTKEGYEDYTGTVEFDMLEAQATVFMTAAPVDPATPMLTVKVTDKGGVAVADANVYFNNKEYTTNASGKAVITDFTAEDVQGKKVAVEVYKDGYAPFTGEADFTEGVQATVDVVLEVAEATLTVKVMDGEDPVAGATVTFEEKEYTTDENGEAKITGINALDVLGKKVAYTVTKEGYKKFEGEADFTETIEAYAIATLEADGQDSISSIVAAPAAGKAYDLQGRAVKNPAKGLYIINGKKVVLN